MNKEVADQKSKETAYHEAGHCVAGYLIQPGGTIKCSTIIPFTRDGTSFLGITCWEGNSLTDDKAVSKLYGGNTAERIFKGDDPITLRTVATYNPETQEITTDPEVFFANNYDPTKPYEKIYEETRDFLIDNWGAVEAVAKALLKAKNLEGAEIVKIIEA